MVNLLIFFSSTAEGSLCRYGVFVCHIFQHCFIFYKYLHYCARCRDASLRNVLI